MRTAVIIIVASIILILILAALGPVLVPTATYKKIVENSLARGLDARVEIEEFGLKLLPYPGYTIRGMRLVSTKPPFQGMPLIQAKMITGTLSFPALIRGKIDTEVDASDVNIDIRISSGITNLGMVFGLSPAQAASIPASAENKLMIRSIEVVRGKITIHTEGNAPPLAIENASLAVKNFGTNAPNSADISIIGSLGNVAQPNVSAAGRIIINTAGREFSAKDLKLYVNGSRFSADTLINLGVSPVSYDIHAATPDLTAMALQPFLPLIGGKLPLGISWQGTIAADVSFKGTHDAGELGLSLDAAAARVTSGTFSKEAGLPFKATAVMLTKPAAITISQATLSFGDDMLGVSGEILRDENLNSRLSIAGRALKLSSIRIFFPWFSGVDALEGVDADLTLQGGLSSDLPLVMEGKFSTAKAEIGGIALANTEGSFTRQENNILFHSLRGVFAGGQLSGNGSIGFGENFKFYFDTVVDGIEASSIPSLHGALFGPVSIVAKVQSEGSDSFSLAKNLAVSGSLVLPYGRISAFDLAGGLFSADLWKTLEEYGKSLPDETAEKKLSAATGDISNFKVSFEIKNNSITASEISWYHELYSALVAMTIDSSGTLSGEGFIRISKEISLQLIRDAAAEKLLFEKGNTLLLPVIAGGIISAPKLSLNRTKFASIIEQNTKIAEAAAQAAGKAAAKSAQPARKAKAKIAAPDQKTSPEGEANKPLPKLPNQEEEDILKVIIGQ